MELEPSPQLVKIDDNTTIDINNTPFSIGRGTSNNFIISSKLVSRKHCVFTKKALGWFITDCSTNGTRLNNEVLHFNEGKLKEGDVITLTCEPFIYRFLPNIIEVVNISDEQLLDVAQRVESQEMQRKHALAVEDTISKKQKTTEETPSEKKDVRPEIPVLDEATTSNASSSSHMNMVEDELACSICSELFIKAVTLNCSHTYCKLCIETWNKNKKICPICRAPITFMNPTLVVDNVIAKALEKATDEVKEHRKVVIAEREELDQKKKPNKQEVIELSDNDSDSSNYFLDDNDDNDTDYSGSEDYLNDDWYNSSGSNHRRYYAGYGACYSCGEQGHWANSCPERRGRAT